MPRPLRIVTAIAVSMVVVLPLLLVSYPHLLPALPRRKVSHAGSGTNRDLKPCPLPGAGAFSISRLRVTALFSFPGSGNTWLRHLLTTATGILTGSVYNTERDIPVTRDRAHRVLVVKTHFSPKRSSKNVPMERAILLIRNPYDALLAEFNRRGNYSTLDNPDALKTGLRPLESFEKAWPRFLRITMGRWLETNLAWAVDNSPMHIIVYKRLKDHLERELRDVLAFLNQSHTGLVHCALRAREGRAHRKKANWQRKVAVFTEEQTNRLNKHIDLVQKALENKTGQDFSDFQQWKR